MACSIAAARRSTCSSPAARSRVATETSCSMRTGLWPDSSQRCGAMEAKSSGPPGTQLQRRL